MAQDFENQWLEVPPFKQEKILGVMAYSGSRWLRPSIPVTGRPHAEKANVKASVDPNSAAHEHTVAVIFLCAHTHP